MWFTTDGSRFQPLDASAFASDDPANHPIALHGLIKGPAGYLAVGTRYDPLTSGQVGPVSALVWRSADGLHWTRLDVQGLPASGLASIATTSNGYVVVPEPSGNDASATPPEAHFSSDGTSWQATSVLAVKVVGANGHVVALTSQSAVAVTDDGKAWTNLHPAKQVVNLAASSDGFIGIAYDQATTKMSVIRSSDGRSWTNAGEPSASWISGMTYAMGLWVMLGQTSGGLNTIPLLTSADALSWQRSAIPQQVIGDAMIRSPIHPFQGGFFAQTQVELSPGGLTAYGPLQVHLWWVRAAEVGDAAGSTTAPEPTFSTPTGGISEAQAIAVATAHYPAMKGTQPYGKLVTIGGFDPKETLVSPDRLVWALMVIVPKPECSPPPSPKQSACDLPYTSVAVLVDYMSGDIIEALDSNGAALP